MQPLDGNTTLLLKKNITWQSVTRVMTLEFGLFILFSLIKRRLGFCYNNDHYLNVGPPSSIFNGCSSMEFCYIVQCHKCFP